MRREEWAAAAGFQLRWAVACEAAEVMRRQRAFSFLQTRQQPDGLAAAGPGMQEHWKALLCCTHVWVIGGLGPIG